MRIQSAITRQMIRNFSHYSDLLTIFCNGDLHFHQKICFDSTKCFDFKILPRTAEKFRAFGTCRRGTSTCTHACSHMWCCFHHIRAAAMVMKTKVMKVMKKSAPADCTGKRQAPAIPGRCSPVVINPYQARWGVKPSLPEKDQRWQSRWQPRWLPHAV